MTKSHLAMRSIIPIILLSFFSLMLVFSCNTKQKETQENSETSVSNPVNEDLSSVGVEADHPEDDQDVTREEMTPEMMDVEADTLIGRWLRPDGNYVLQINAVNGDQIDAQYFNPKPIRVAKAEVIPSDNLHIFVEFSDVGYEGSSYDLVYDPVRDVLSGQYYLAAYGQTYQIGFIRMEE